MPLVHNACKSYSTLVYNKINTFVVIIYVSQMELVCNVIIHYSYDGLQSKSCLPCLFLCSIIFNCLFILVCKICYNIKKFSRNKTY